MFPYPKWRGITVVPSHNGIRELTAEGLDLNSLVELLEISRPSAERRKQGVIEVIAGRGEKSFKIVLAESLQEFTGELVYLVVHVKSVRRS